MENQTAEKLTILTKEELTIIYGAFAGEFSIK
jgi:hypothetical protein